MAIMDKSLVQMLLNNWIVLLILGSVAAGLITSIAKQIRKYGCFRQEVELKRELVERGLSVDEIERVIAAKSTVTMKDSTS
jgi:hypothetical protein